MKKLQIGIVVFLLLLGICVTSKAETDEMFLQRGEADVAKMEALRIEAARMADRWQDHDSLYANWNHLWFSWFGHKEPTQTDLIKSMADGWWGEEVKL